MWHYNYSYNELCHYGVLGMKWGVRKKYEPINSGSASSEKKKSNHRLKLEEKYRFKGMAQDEAEKRASKRIKMEKVIAITAGVTVAAAAAYVARNEYVKKQIATFILRKMRNLIKSSGNMVPKASYRDSDLVQ